jgi:hypothetical protein
MFGLAVALVGVAITGAERSISLVLSTIDRNEMIHPQFHLKLEAAGSGVLVPVLFVKSASALVLLGREQPDGPSKLSATRRSRRASPCA